MLTVVGCLVEAHDFRLVALAAGICALSALTTICLVSHARWAAGWPQAGWLAVAATAGGSGIWATHFIAMLAFVPGVPSGYDVALTGLSLVIAVLLAGSGLSLAVIVGGRASAWAGGAILGFGIAAMHYTGMAAYDVAGHKAWDPATVGVSLALGGILGGAALAAQLGARGLVRQVPAALLLLLAICSHHFTAMGAVTVTPDPTRAVSEAAIPNAWLAVAVALASFAILLLAGAALALDVRDRRHAKVEADRLHSLANAAVEGLVVCTGDAIVSANRSFAKLIGLPSGALAGTALSAYLPGNAARLALAGQPERPVEAELRRADGTLVPVEIIMQPVDHAGRPHYAVAVRDLRARRQAERQIQFLAHHDALTGLANRASFGKRLEQEMRAVDAGGRKLAVLCLDLDRFKEVNDLFGHAAGDAMLENVARIVSAELDDTQMMARLGGDEFAVLMPCGGPSEAGRLAERILEALRSGRADAGGPQIATSIGVVLYPDDAQERAALLSYADTALYRAKSEGRGTYRFFEARMGVEVRERRLLEHDLRHAVARGEMQLVYQPQTNVGSGAVIGFEALLRWKHPERGYVTPALFIPIAEESDAILQIGEWVLREACREAATWSNPLSIAVNVSAVQIHSPHFVGLVHEVLLKTGLAPGRLEVEVTETALISDPNRALLTLRQLKSLGLRIAMDDFGTGYSSLSNLRSFPFDKIKIDGSFVRSVDSNEQTAAIVRSVLGLGRGLGLPVLAEGVETDAELGFLAAEQCHAAQGYLMGRPSPIGQFAQHTHGTDPVIADDRKRA
ncbi:diguanylate cyclase [Methylobacterium gregans]|jgi:diguanylate cyclase (GGDEF)-like protein/PAS domain S-box-containing protein|uniref:Signaling protein n=1 Tax=Methylobacterium gregans TaxID=374424 RepID=A0AA37HN67_9HYPH|nr:EAL domain-containing protein [Methylobacterium gregans]MDQ0522352.1 diguanylate cyclase (GGDEF)-like protein/PAS domain S-box-containing protein [Methylobacterium gregans]GJD78942.1 putative signaling protein [Methylobacterium gregans]GLS55094.1 diguanylate cyclase [Methylobacterium gregans]